MSYSHTKIYIHYVFAVKFRRNLIVEEIRESIEKYITGIVKQKKPSMIEIYCMPDHCPF